MASKIHMKRNSNQTERISLIAEILLEGALRLMEKHNDIPARSNPTELRNLVDNFLGA